MKGWEGDCVISVATMLSRTQNFRRIGQLTAKIYRAGACRRAVPASSLAQTLCIDSTTTTISN